MSHSRWTTLSTYLVPELVFCVALLCEAMFGQTQGTEEQSDKAAGA